MNWKIDDIGWARRLKLRHLEVFLVLNDARSITAAAHQMHMTQPAVSHWLSDIEELIGTPLFVRGRQLKLTVAGEVLRRHAERMLGDVRRTSEELSAVRAGLSGRLHVGSILSAAPVLLPKAITRLQREFPNVYVHIAEATLEVLLERLQRRELDLIIGPLDVRAHKSGFPSELLVEDTVSVVASPGHPFARRRKPTWQDAASCTWIMPPSGTLMRLRLEGAFLDAKTAIPIPRIETASIIAIQMLLRETEYITVLAGSVANLYKSLGLVEQVRLTPNVQFGPVGMLWEKEQPDAMLAQLISAFRLEAAVLRRGAFS
ncbi:MAG: LysR family transcriptional regulator [Longimicrobiales bacterium]